MYAVIVTGGKQYRVQPGEIIRVEKLAGEKGAKISFDQVLLHADGDTVKIGAPHVAGLKVSGEIVDHGRGKKVLVYKYRRRKGYRRKNGHRQSFTAVKITAIA
jgi:large subunit ribosomal protein L21